MPTLYLFPGAHKTGSSLLQRALEICRPQIESQGIAIARRSKYYEHIHRDLRLRRTKFAESINEISSKLPLVFETSTLNSDLILSVENAFGEFGVKPYGATDRVLEHIRALFPEHDIKATYYIRRQDTFLESYYVQCIHKGADMDWADFWKTYETVPIRWAKIISIMEEKIGPENLRVRAFEEIKRGPHRFIRRFFEDIENLDAEALSRSCRGKLTNTNISLSQQGIDIVRAGFTQIEERRERERFAKHMQALYGVDSGPRFQIAADVRRQIAEQYADENLRICDRIGASAAIRSHYAFTDVLA